MTRPLALAAALLLALPGLLVAAPDPLPGHESPTAVWNTFATAAAADKWNEVYACYETASAQRLLAGVALNADAWVRTRLTNDQQKTDEWNAIVSRTGLRVKREEIEAEARREADAEAGGDGSDTSQTGDGAAKKPAPLTAQQLLSRVIARVTDRPAAFQAVMAFMARATGRANPPFKGRLDEVKEDGDRATATLVEERAGQEKRSPMAFRRVDGSWYIELPSGD